MRSTPLYRLPPSSERNTAAGVFAGSALAIVGGLLGVVGAVTPWAAWKLGSQAGLGPPLVAR